MTKEHVTARFSKVQLRLSRAVRRGAVLICWLPVGNMAFQPIARNVVQSGPCLDQLIRYGYILEAGRGAKKVRSQCISCTRLNRVDFDADGE